MAHKIQLTAKATSEFRKSLNTEYKGFNACIKFLVANWNNKEIIKLAKADGLNKSDLTAEYIIKHLEGTNWVQNGVMGHVVTDKETGEKVFKAWPTWTPGRVFDYARRASAAHCKALGLK